MNQSIFLNKALCLPSLDIEALISGETVVSLAPFFMQKGQSFVIYPSDLKGDLSDLENVYKSDFLANYQVNFDSVINQSNFIKTWAKCYECEIINQESELEKIFQVTIWQEEFLNQIFAKKGNLILIYLQVYQFNELIEVPPIKLKYQVIPFHKSVNTQDSKIILTENLFNTYYEEIKQRKIKEKSALEYLINELTQISSNQNAQDFIDDIKTFLGFNQIPKLEKNTDLDWIKTITKLGNSSDGDNFEKVVRKSLQFLGFQNNSNDPKLKNSLNPEKIGGAGGLDVYADYPYSIVGECKASQYIMGNQGAAVGQLINLGNTHLTTTEYNNCIKFIFTSGQLTPHANNGAIGNNINIMRNETLERLVEIKANFPGLINLFELKTCLEKEPFGVESDDKINEYIDQILTQIEIRSKIINLVKQLKETNLDQLDGAYRINNNSQPLTKQEISEILIELSSPLVGYLGRKKGDNRQNDRFYVVRELEI